MKSIIIEIVGWLGMVMIVLAYALISFSIIKPDILYQILSGGGAIGVIIVSFYKRAYQPGGFKYYLVYYRTYCYY